MAEGKSTSSHLIGFRHQLRVIWIQYAIKNNDMTLKSHFKAVGMELHVCITSKFAVPVTEKNTIVFIFLTSIPHLTIFTPIICNSHIAYEFFIEASQEYPI